MYWFRSLDDERNVKEQWTKWEWWLYDKHGDNTILGQWQMLWQYNGRGNNNSGKSGGEGKVWFLNVGKGDTNDERSMGVVRMMIEIMKVMMNDQILLVTYHKNIFIGSLGTTNTLWITIQNISINVVTKQLVHWWHLRLRNNDKKMKWAKINQR